MSDDNIIKLISNGKANEFWESVHIKSSMLGISGECALSSIDFFETEPKNNYLKMNNSYKLQVNGENICSGYPDDIDIIHEDKFHSFQFYGRDITGDLEDCTFSESINVWKKQSIKNIITNLCRPFNIPVVTDTSVTSIAATKIETFKAEEGMSYEYIINKLCREYGIIPVSYGDNKLTLTGSSTTRKSQDTIEVERSNVIYGKLLQSNRNRFKKYIVKGYGISSDNKGVEDYIHPKGVYNDPTISRYRPFTEFADNIVDSGICEKRAQWEATRRYGLSRILEYKLDNWKQENGKLWRINTLVDVKDILLDIKREMLIYEIEYILNNEDGIYCILRIADKNIFSMNNTMDFKTGFDK